MSKRTNHREIEKLCVHKVVVKYLEEIEDSDIFIDIFSAI